MTDKNRLMSLLFITIAGLVLICVTLVNVIDTKTREKINENRLQASMRIFDDIIPEGYTNEIFSDSIEVTEPGYMGTSRPVTIYRARNNGEPVSVIIYPVIAKGYSGDIELGIGISSQGVLNGVVVVYEEETPGVGDLIRQDKTDWIMMFTGRSLDDPSRDDWRVTKDDGDFDQLSGATITSRNVVNAIKNVLEYHDINGENLYTK